MLDFLRQFLRLAGEQFSESVDRTASAVVDVVEHPEHVVAALKEEEVEDGQSAKSERLRILLALEVDADLLQIPRLIHQPLK